MWNNNNIFEEQIFLNTVLIENLSDWEFWTWFLIEKEINYMWNNLKFILLFSNKHVFFWKKDWQTSNPWITKLIKFYLHSQDKKWELVLWKRI